jgi:hypothetical protein
MEQETTSPARGRSRLVDAMGWMRRSGMLYIILAFTMASCKSCDCSGCKDQVNRFICQVWQKTFGCGQICTAKLRLVDEHGNQLTNMRPDAFVILKVTSATNSSDVLFSGNVHINADGTSDVLQLRHCVDPCNTDLAGNPFSFAIFGFLLKSADPACTPDCRYWGVSSGGSDINFGVQNCVLIVNARVVSGMCGPC